MNPIPSFVAGLTIGPPRVFDRLTVYPLSHSQSAQLRYSHPRRSHQRRISTDF